MEPHESFEIKAEWGARAESVGGIAARTSRYLRALGQIDPTMQEWRECQMRPQRREDLRDITNDEAALVAQMEDFDREHRVRSSIMGLGYYLSLWSGNVARETEDEKVSIGIHAGDIQTDMALRNDVRLRIPWSGRAYPELRSVVERAMEEAGIGWAPDCIAVESSSAPVPETRQGDSTPRFDWMLYVRREWAPAIGKIRGARTWQDGFLVVTQEDPIDWSDPAQARLAEDMRVAVRRALPKRVTGRGWTPW